MSEIPQELIEAMAESLIDDMLRYFKDPEIQKKYEIWKKKRDSEDLCSQG